MADKKRMRIKRARKRKKKLKILFAFSFFFLFVGSFYYIISTLALRPEQRLFLQTSLKSGNHFYQGTTNKKVIPSLVRLISHVDIYNPTSVFGQGSAVFEEKRDRDEDVDVDDLEDMSEYVKDPDPNQKKENPMIYIYNTHQLEQYSTSNVEPYNVKPNVMMTSYILREKLNGYKIPSLVEENNVTEILRTNGWNYASSYKVTRMLMEDAKEKNNTLKYFIDVHRDSVNKNISTANIKGKNYAKILFIVGLENPNYPKNLALTERINELLKENYPGITRGIYKKEGKGVNGVYNQDFSETTILIEMGGEENTIDEVLNSTEAIAFVLNKVIKEAQS